MLKFWSVINSFFMHWTKKLISAVEKKPFQFWREIWIQVLVILLQLYMPKFGGDAMSLYSPAALRIWLVCRCLTLSKYEKPSVVIQSYQNSFKYARSLMMKKEMSSCTWSLNHRSHMRFFTIKNLFNYQETTWIEDKLEDDLADFRFGCTLWSKF